LHGGGQRFEPAAVHQPVYREYRQRAIAFIKACNRRIAEYCRLRALEDRS
jgi:hypothetical protein